MIFTKLEEEAILARSNFDTRFAPTVIQVVRDKYCEPNRHYHDWNHALSVLSWVNHACDIHLIHESFDHKYELNIAALFHDVIYTSQGSPKNEQDSVAFLRATLGIAHPKAEEIILATALHGKLEYDDVPFLTAVFMDCDIASFGESRWEIAVWNDQNITKELLQRYSAEQVQIGRKAFLSGLLAKHSIFLTPYFQDRFEAQARRNIRRIITELVPNISTAL